MTTERLFSTGIPVRRVKGSVRAADVPPRGETIRYGIHGQIAEYYGHPSDAPDSEASPIDHFIAAVGTALIGGLGRNLSRIGFDCDEGRLSGVATGHFADDGVLYVESMDVDFVMHADQVTDVAAVEHAFRIHVPECPITRTLGSEFRLRVSLTIDVQDGTTLAFRHGGPREES